MLFRSTNLGELLVHGIAIKPGKPAVLGMIGKKPFCGMPGYPVSGIIVMEEIVKYVCALLTHREPERDETVKAQVSRKLTSSLKYEEFLRCRVAEVDGKNIAVPMPRGAGVVTGFAKAGGLFVVDQNSEGLEAGATVDVALQRDKVELENSLSITGSHDPLIDEAADLLIRQDERTYVVSSHVGSMGAIMALRAGETALGGIHLLDAESGEYNKAYVRQYFPNGGVTLIRCVIRQQGLIGLEAEHAGPQADTAAQRIRAIIEGDGHGVDDGVERDKHQHDQEDGVNDRERDILMQLLSLLGSNRSHRYPPLKSAYPHPASSPPSWQRRAE